APSGGRQGQPKLRRVHPRHRDVVSRPRRRGEIPRDRGSALRRQQPPHLFTPSIRRTLRPASQAPRPFERAARLGRPGDALHLVTTDSQRLAAGPAGSIDRDGVGVNRL
ncbi:MAG: hypothetical protein ACK55I_43090, partial [bacterium]